jgi:pimeloyl-ACP methyl ester carboxylesterase
MPDAHETRYAKSAGLDIAYEVVGYSSPDLVVVSGFVSNIETSWESPEEATFFERLASFTRLILFDKRGTGLSDRVPVDRLPTLEDRMDDVRAVMDAAGSERAALFGWSEGGPMSVLFAATYPERVSHLILYGSYARRASAQPDNGHAFTERIERDWGTGTVLGGAKAAADPVLRRALARKERQCATPTAAAALVRMAASIDVTDVLAAVSVPTLVMHRREDSNFRVAGGRELARGIPGARYLELDGSEHMPWYGDSDAILEEIEEFLTGTRQGGGSERVLTTVLFTDIVGATPLAAELGDRRWNELLEQHHALTRAQLRRFRGVEVDTAGDGFFATFDGPARAIRCALALTEGLAQLGVTIRAGVHTGEVERVRGSVRGIAVHIGARIGALAGPGEVLTSRTVRELVAGSGIEFAERGEYQLKGVPGASHLFAAQ